MPARVAAVLAVALAAGALSPAGEPTWGVPANSLRLGLSRDTPRSPDLLVSFSGTAPAGSPPLLVLLGGRSGAGPLYSLEFTATHPNGDTCRLLNSLGGVVGGSVGPILVSIAPGANHAIAIPLLNLSCTRPTGQATGLSRLLALGYSVQATFKTSAADTAWAHAPSAWTGEIRSRPLAAEPLPSQ